MNYNIKFDVPAKYLGTEANSLIAKLSPNEAIKLENIPVNAILSGSFSNPKIKTDMKSAVANLTNQLVQQQKEKIVGKGTSALTDLLNKNKKAGDTTKTVVPTTKEEIKEKVTQEVKTKAEDLIKGLFNKKKKTTDTTQGG
jgi:hypothetical protein